MRKLLVAVAGLFIAVMMLVSLGSSPEPVTASEVAPFALNLTPYATKAPPTNQQPGAKQPCIPCCGICECERSLQPDGICSWYPNAPYAECVAIVFYLPTVDNLIVNPKFLDAAGNLDTAKVRAAVPEGVEFEMPASTAVEWLTNTEVHERRQAELEGREVGLVVNNVRIR